MEGLELPKTVGGRLYGSGRKLVWPTIVTIAETIKEYARAGQASGQLTPFR